MLASRCLKNLFIILLVLLVSVPDVYSQGYSFIRYDTRDGLGGSVVYDAIQDKEGFMWFATENGLSRFDGKNFKTFTTKDGLPDNEILKLFVDSEGRLWIMPFKPSICYYYKGKIYNRNNDSLLSRIQLSSYAFDIVEDRVGNLFIAAENAYYEISTDQTIKTIDRANNIPVKNPLIKTLPDYYGVGVDAIGLNRSGEAQLLATVYDGKRTIECLVDIKKQTIELTTEAYWPDLQTSIISPDYVITSSKHSSRLTFYKDTTRIISTETPANTVSITYINRNKIIVNTRTGIKFFDPETNTFSDLIFKDFSFTSAFEDKENNLWLTTSGSGVLMVPSFQFRNYSHADDKKNSEITALSIISDTVYAGGWTNKIWKVNVNSLAFSSQVDPSHEEAKIISISRFNENLTLINSGYYKNPYNRNKQPLALKSVSVGRSGILFAGHSITLLCKSSGEEEIIWTGRSTCAIEKDSGYYIGTLNGLMHKSYDGQIVYLGKVFPELASRIVNLAVSGKGILWITTKGNGVVAYSQGKLIHHFTETDGLTSDNCISLYVDSNNVWLGTDKGLNRIELSSTGSRITRFSMSDGLPSNVINAIAAIGKKVFVGTPMGLTYFETDKISQASSCDLQLTGIYLANKYWTYDSTGFSLPHKNNDIRFEFSGISFKSAGEMRYQYRMLGLQPEWRPTTDEQLSFPSLSSGNYSLQLKAINKYGVESKVKEISFVIGKLPRETTWFRLSMLLLLIGLVWLFVRYRVGRVRKKEKEQAMLNQRFADLEQKALRSQMNPHFIFNCLNSIQQYVAERDITGANNFITDFSRLIRMTLDLSTNTLINMSDEIEYITTYLKIEKARLENQFDYSVKTDNTLNLHEIYLPPLLLQPYVENSIRHGIKYKKDKNGMVCISVQKKGVYILVSIEDNGIGRAAAQQYKSQYHIQYQSKGMSINNDRIDILNSYNDKKIEIFVEDLYDNNATAAGTRVELYLLQ